MLARLLILTLTLPLSLAAPIPTPTALAIWELDPFIQRLIDLDLTFYDRYILTGKIDGIGGLPLPAAAADTSVNYPQVVHTKEEYEAYKAISKRHLPPAHPERRQVSANPNAPAVTLSVTSPRPLWNKDTGTNYRDVKQTKLGDCWLASVMTAISFVNPWWIPSLFVLPVPNDPNTDRAGITLYLDPQTTLNTSLADMRASPYAAAFSVSGSLWWPAAIEHALSVHFGSTGWPNMLTAGGMPAWALNWFTQRPQQTLFNDRTIPRFDFQNRIDEITAAMAFGPVSPVMIATSLQARALVAAHAYAVLHADTAKKTVILLNPWGTVAQYNVVDIALDIIERTFLADHASGP